MAFPVPSHNPSILADSHVLIISLLVVLKHHYHPNLPPCWFLICCHELWQVWTCAGWPVGQFEKIRVALCLPSHSKDTNSTDSQLQVLITPPISKTSLRGWSSLIQKGWQTVGQTRQCDPISLCSLWNQAKNECFFSQCKQVHILSKSSLMIKRFLILWCFIVPSQNNKFPNGIS